MSSNNVCVALTLVSFPDNCEEMVVEDARTVLIFQIISNLFSEINFYIFNILACQNI